MNHVWGRGMGRRGLGGGECRLCRETGISSERGLEVEEGADDTISTSSCVLGTLAFEDAVKVRASIAQREAGGVGRRFG